jgi:hypothetical protein
MIKGISSSMVAGTELDVNCVDARYINNGEVPVNIARDRAYWAPMTKLNDKT